MIKTILPNQEIPRCFVKENKPITMHIKCIECGYQQIEKNQELSFYDYGKWLRAMDFKCTPSFCPECDQDRYHKIEKQTYADF